MFLLDFEFVMLMGVWSECVFGGVVRARVRVRVLAPLQKEQVDALQPRSFELLHTIVPSPFFRCCWEAGRGWVVACWQVGREHECL